MRHVYLKCHFCPLCTILMKNRQSRSAELREKYRASEFSVESAEAAAHLHLSRLSPALNMMTGFTSLPPIKSTI